MIFKKFTTPGIAHVAYLIGDEGEAALVDPRRDVDEYAAFACENKLAIKYVLETHRQEDFVIGTRAIVESLGAKVATLDHALFGHVPVHGIVA
jgi:hydroxyacylglutathione hydrolase